MREEQILLNCDHKNVVKMFYSIKEDTNYHFVLEYCNDGTLTEKINESEMGLEENVALKYFMDIMNGI